MLNQEYFAESKRYIPGGVNSPVRSFNAVGGEPFITQKANGCFLYDVDDKRYIDYVCSWGANIVGHANKEVVNCVSEVLKRGFSFGTPSELELEFARLINKLMPSIAKFRLVSSGTEAVMTAVRLARGYTNKKIIIKFNGCYHGHSDNLLVKAGSGLATFDTSSSAGVPDEVVKYTISIDYNNILQLQNIFAKHGHDIACVIIEPFAGNMNLVRPSVEFIKTIQDLCNEYGSLFIFDEVMTGFRVGIGGAQNLLGIKPDLTILGKVIGGGMPLAGFGGRADIMDKLSPLGPVYQAGTLSGNPVAVSCGLATLKLIQESDFYVKLVATAKKLTDGLKVVAKKHNILFNADYIGGMFGFYFSDTIPTDYNSVKQGNQVLFNQFFHEMCSSGVFFAPSMFEAGFVCSAHSLDIIDETILIADEAFSKLKSN